jgi:hypothetical protein
VEWEVGSGEDDTVGVDEGLPLFVGGAVISGGNYMSSPRKCSAGIRRLSIALHSVFWQNIFQIIILAHTVLRIIHKINKYHNFV